MTAIPIYTNAGPERRRALCLNHLAYIVGELKRMSDKDTFTDAEIEELDDAEMALQLIRAKLSTRGSMGELCGKFGRAP